MVRHTFSLTDLFYAQYYRYRVLFTILILGFGLFAIGVMVFDGAPFIIGCLLFVAYCVMAYMVMFLFLLIVAYVQYRSYKNVQYAYQLEDMYFVVKKDNQEIVRVKYEEVTTKVYKKLTFVYDVQQIVAFFPESVRQQLL